MKHCYNKPIMDVLKKYLLNKRNLLLVLGCIGVVLLSLSFRAQWIFTPEVFDYEWHSSTVVRYLEAWDQKGGFSGLFVPSVTYEGAANQNINNHSSIQVGRLGYSDANGDFYYVSYPPFAYIAPYAIFKLFFIEPDIIAVRVFNLFVQFATAGVIALLLLQITRSRVSAFLGFSLYVFLPVSLYVHGTTYMSDMLVQLPFALAGLFFYNFLKAKDGQLKKRHLLLLSISLFTAVYTEWLGVFMCAFIGGYALLHWTKDRHARDLFLASAAAGSLAVALTVLQYASVADLRTFVTVMSDRYLNGYDSTETVSPLASQIGAIVGNYVKWHGVALMSIVILYGSLVLARMRGFEVSKHIRAYTHLGPVLFFFTVSIVLHHVIFLDWTAYQVHFYALLKSALLIALVLPLLCDVWWKTFSEKLKPMRLFAGVLLCAVFFNAVQVYAEELVTRDKSGTTNYCDFGKQIAQHTAPDEVVFMRPLTPERFNGILSATTVLCAKRNIALYTNQAEAHALIEKNNASGGMLYIFEYEGGIMYYIGMQRVNYP